MSGRPFRVLSAHNRQADAFTVLWRFRNNEPHAEFDLIDVQRSKVPIKAICRWAVIRYLPESDD